MDYVFTGIVYSEGSAIEKAGLNEGSDDVQHLWEAWRSVDFRLVSPLLCCALEIWPIDVAKLQGLEMDL